MGKPDIIFIDMFQTLVDIDTRRRNIWLRLLGTNYCDNLSEEFSCRMSSLIASRYHEIVNRAKGFRTLRQIFRDLLKEIDISEYSSLSLEDSAEVLISEHSKAEPYSDATDFVSRVSEHYRICLISDSDADMIQPHLNLFNFDKSYISEEVQSYKNDKSGRIFTEALKAYNIQPENVIHIGDSASDIIGASRVGIKSCWLNRLNTIWDHNIKPDFEVKDLNQAASILLHHI